MTPGFWKNTKRPIIGLAPMDGVTDAAFRYITAKYGRPDVIITEFTAAEGIRAGALRLLDDFFYDPIERPVVAQLFGSDPQAFYIGSLVASAMGFDGIDINMGCPAKNVTQRGAGAALIEDPQRAKAIIASARAGNEAWANGIGLLEGGVPEVIAEKVIAARQRLQLQERRLLPISVKTRTGVREVVVKDWIQHLLETQPAAITVHGRTLSQLYSGLADWEVIAEAAALVRQTDSLILGNGDVATVKEAQEKCTNYSLDGVLIGRASFGNPWIFQNQDVSLAERLQVALEHARYLHTTLEGRGFLRIRKHLLDYTRGFTGAKEIRMQLMHVKTIGDVENVLAPVVTQSSI